MRSRIKTPVAKAPVLNQKKGQGGVGGGTGSSPGWLV